MIRLANTSIRHPKAALAFWVVFAAIFVAIGLGVTDRLSPTLTLVSGTNASHAQRLAEDEFGPGVLVPILLEGPQAELDRQGPPLVRRLAERPDTRVLSAWDAGNTAEELRPSKTQALIVASVARSEQQMLETYQGQIDRTVEDAVAGPVRSHVTSATVLDRAIKEEALETTREKMLIALPILFVALLLILRAPLAAAAATVFGGVTAFVGFGVMSVLAKALDADAIGLALASVMGLAMGTGLSLLILTRFKKEEAAVAGAPREAAIAASAAVATTGRAVLIAGAGLIASLAVASLVGPTENLNSIGVGVISCALLGVGAAVVVMPAVLALTGPRMFALGFGAPWFIAAPWRRLVGARGLVLKRAVPAALVGILALVALALPVTGLKTGPPDPAFLPEHQKARQDFEAIQRAMGPGWPTPYNIIVSSDKRPLTDRKLLLELERLQVRIARDPRVKSVAGPGTFRAETADLGTLETKLNETKKLLPAAKKDLGKLQGGLGQAAVGTLQLQGALRQAADGARQLQGGGNRAEEGAAQLRDGLAAARSGSAQISDGLDTALAGANDLKSGAGQALAGAEQLSGGLGQAAGPLREGLPVVRALAQTVTEASGSIKDANANAQALAGQLDAAIAALESMSQGKSDPQYQQALAAAREARGTAGGVASTLGATDTKVAGAAGISTALAGQVEQLSDGLTQLHSGSTELTSGIARLREGNGALAEGLEQLSGGAPELTTGLGQLQDGAGQLQQGLGLLTGGAGELGSGLAGGVPKVGELTAGLGLMESGIAKFRQNLPGVEDLDRLQAQSPGLFDSGYFVLAAIEGAQPNSRNQAMFALNLERGGNAGQIVVVPKQSSRTEATQQLGEDLDSMAAAFGKRTATEVAVGGPAGELADFESDVGGDIWPVILAITLAVMLVLMVALRSIAMPIVTVALNLLTAAATFGVLTLLTTGDDPLLGGPGYIDSLQVIETFAAVFGIALIYEVLLLHRARTLFVRSGRAQAALNEALRDTAGAATGAAAVMVAAVAPFVTSHLFNLRLTIALAISILIDAIVVRPVLLPAIAQLLGPRAWWPTRPRSDGEPEEMSNAPTRRFTRRRRAATAA